MNECFFCYLCVQVAGIDGNLQTTKFVCMQITCLNPWYLLKFCLALQSKILRIILQLNKIITIFRKILVLVSYIKLRQFYNSMTCITIIFLRSLDLRSMIDESYLKIFTNNIYLCKITIQEILVLIFLQLDWMLKIALFFCDVQNV